MLTRAVPSYLTTACSLSRQGCNWEGTLVRSAGVNLQNACDGRFANVVTFKEIVDLVIGDAIDVLVGTQRQQGSPGRRSEPC